MKAFVLGAGLGTRLRPLTAVLPKPLIPVWNKPLITYAFDHLLASGVSEFVVNTHHLPHKFAEFFPTAEYAGARIQFVEEQPVVLETGGGLANAAPHLVGGDFFVYNGDILADLPLQPALDAHQKSGDLVTLILRSEGPNRNVHFDPASGKVKDLRGSLGTQTSHPYQFTGIYLVNPAFLEYLTPEPESVVPAWLKLIQKAEQLGGVVIDEGQWWDLGKRSDYLAASATLEKLRFPSFPTHDPHPVRVHPEATVDPKAEVDDFSSLGKGCRVGPDARITKSILWPGTQVGEDAVLDRCIIVGITKQFPPEITGSHVGADL